MARSVARGEQDSLASRYVRTHRSGRQEGIQCKGSIRPRKHGKHKVWVAQWWEDGHRRSKVLGKCSRMPKSEAEARMAQILERTNAGAGHPEKPVYTFGVYVEQVFLPLCRRKWKESTRMTTELRFNYHLLPAFAPMQLKAITRYDLQDFLDRKGKELSRSVVDHLRWDLNAIFKTAMSDGVEENNPASALFTPVCKETGEKRFMTPDQVRRALSVLDLRERLIFRMAVFDGMRPGEILAIQLGNIREHSVLIDKRVYKGNIYTPKGRKGKRTARVVALSPGTVQDLALWRDMLLEGRQLPVPHGTQHSAQPGQHLEPAYGAEAGESRLGVGYVPGLASDERPTWAEGIHRRQGRRRPAGPRSGCQFGGLLPE